MLRPASTLVLCGLALLFPVILLAEPAPPGAAAPAMPATPALAADILPQPLAQALENLQGQTGLQWVSVDGVVSNQQTRGGPAGLASEEALKRLLQGTQLRYEFINARTVRILAGNPPQGTDPPPLLPMPEVLILAHRIAKPYVAPATAKEQKELDAANADLETRIAREHLLYGNDGLDLYVQGVAERLLAADQTDATNVHVRVIKGAEANAFALSNGSIYLTTTLLATLDDEAQLAAVLGHELTHYLNCDALRGLREEHKQQITAITVGTILSIVFAVAANHNGVYTGTPLIRPETMQIWARASITGYSRTLEREADDGAIRRMIAAGYDPTGALAALQHLAQQTDPKQARQTPLYASHPRIEQRMASYRDLLARELAGAAGVGERRREEYRAQLGQLPLDVVAVQLESGALDRAEHLLTAQIAATDSGRAEFLKGEIYRQRVPQTDATVQMALVAYERAVALADAPVSAYRQAGLLHRMRGESQAATVAFQTYLERAPAAVDAPIVRLYLDELRTPAGTQEIKQ